jgi:ABC-type multidrug transport system permease subunit
LVVLAAGFGILVVSLLKSTRQAGPVLGGVLTITGMLGGIFSFGASLPAAFDAVSLAVPQGWAMRAVKLALDGADVQTVLPTVLLMVVLGAIFFAAGAMRFRSRFG